MQENNPAASPRKPRLPAIEYIRGISMMGVIGIHVGSQYIGNPASNAHLTALFEIFTRFSVPIFFFISAFGLFYNLNLDNWSYSQFLKKRWKTVLIPYLVWSVFYLVHDSWLYGSALPSPLYFCGILFFGVAKYQLYFLVLLLWFYLLMPLWIKMVKKLDMLWLIFLLGLQVMFDYWSSFSEPLNLFVYSLPDDSLLKPFFMYRLNYWVMHYIFIFVLGGWLAVHIKEFHSFMQNRRTLVTCSFFLSIFIIRNIVLCCGQGVRYQGIVCHHAQCAACHICQILVLFSIVHFTVNHMDNRAVHDICVDLNLMQSVLSCRVCEVDMFQIGCVCRCAVFVIGKLLDALESRAQHFSARNELRNRHESDTVNEECIFMCSGQRTAVFKHDNVTDR